MIHHRGYSLTAVGRVWGVSRSRVSQIAADPQRACHWDYALWGLPTRSAVARTDARRLRLLAWLRQAPARTDSKIRNAAALPTVDIGDVWIVRESPGDHLPEGSEGIIQRLSKRDGLLYVHLVFTAVGYVEAIAHAYLQQADCFLSATGRNVLNPPTDPK